MPEEQSRSSRRVQALPNSLLPQPIPWWHWARVVGAYRRAQFWYAERYGPQIVGTLTGTVTWRGVGDGDTAVELLHFDLVRRWRFGLTGRYAERSYVWRSSGRYCQEFDMGGRGHDLYHHALRWSMGEGTEDEWREFAQYTQSVAMQHYIATRRRRI